MHGEVLDGELEVGPVPHARVFEFDVSAAGPGRRVARQVVRRLLWQAPVLEDPLERGEVPAIERR